MSVGFRKSMFGFNREDVLAYINKLHNNFSKKEDALKEEIKKHDDLISELEAKQKALQEEKAILEQKVDEYNKKSAEMERLSENIGKLYMVAQSNAKTIMDNAEENSRISNAEIEKNVYAIEQTQSALDELRLAINKTAENFTTELNGLMNSLTQAKAKITDSSVQDEEASSVFSTLLDSMSAK